MTVVALLVVSGGSTADSVTDAAAPWADIDGRPLIWHAARRLCEAGVARVFLVSDSAHADRAATIARERTFGGSVEVVTAASGTGVRAGVARALAADPTVVLVHDPTRAFAPVAMIRRVVDAGRGGAPVVIPVLPVVDTIRAVGRDGQASALVDRDALRIVQTPQGFDPVALRRRHARAAADGDEVPQSDEAAAAVQAGELLASVPGHADAARVLTAGEIDQARRALGTTVTLPSAADRRVDARG